MIEDSTFATKDFLRLFDTSFEKQRKKSRSFFKSEKKRKTPILEHWYYQVLVDRQWSS